MATFLRATASKDKARALREMRTAGRANRFLVAPEQFSAIPKSPFAYWASVSIVDLFKRMPRLQATNRRARFGASTKDDGRFLRLWFEPEYQTNRWVSHAKGGAFSRFYCDLALVLNWRSDGYELKAFASSYRMQRGWGENWSAESKGAKDYFVRASHGRGGQKDCRSERCRPMPSSGTRGPK